MIATLLLPLLVGAVLVSEGKSLTSSFNDDNKYDKDIAHGNNEVCVNNRPKVAALHPHEINDLSTWAYISINPGDNAMILCSADDGTHLEIRDKNPLSTKQLNTTTIQLFLTNPLSNIQNYYCIDKKSGCKKKFAVLVTPTLTLSSSSARVLDNYYGIRTYFVPLGDDYDVTCSSVDNSLELYKSTDRLKIDGSNLTTVWHKARADKVTAAYYECIIANSDTYTTVSIHVIVDYYPEARNFRCILHNYEKLECTWISLSVKNEYQMFFNDNSKECSCFTAIGSSNSSTCVWQHNAIESIDPLQYLLVLQTCNGIFCNNQTFYYTDMLIRKISPVFNMKVLNMTSRSAFVSWSHRLSHRIWPLLIEKMDALNKDFVILHKIEYRLKAFGEHWREADTSSVRCEHVFKEWGCRFHLIFLYPASDYEVKVSGRFNGTDDALWSDPSSIDTTTLPWPRDMECESGLEFCSASESLIKEFISYNEFKIKLKKKLEKITRYRRVYNDLESIQRFV